MLCLQADTDLAMLMLEASSTASEAAHRLDTVRATAAAAQQVRHWEVSPTAVHDDRCLQPTGWTLIEPMQLLPNMLYIVTCYPLCVHHDCTQLIG